MRHESFRSDADRLIRAIEPILRIKVDHPAVPPDEVEVGTAILLAAAARRECLSYREFSEQLRGHGVSIHWRSPRMAKLLLAISEHRVARGQGLLSALVVGRASGLPGEGFFELAASQGVGAITERFGSTSATGRFRKPRSHRRVRRHYRP